MIRKLTVVEERTYHITNTNDDELAGRRVKHKKENNLYTIVREDSTTFPGCDEDEFFPVYLLKKDNGFYVGTIDVFDLVE